MLFVSVFFCCFKGKKFFSFFATTFFKNNDASFEVIFEGRGKIAQTN
jgi:hypothetical protein